MEATGHPCQAMTPFADGSNNWYVWCRPSLRCIPDFIGICNKQIWRQGGSGHLKVCRQQAWTICINPEWGPQANKWKYQGAAQAAFGSYWAPLPGNDTSCRWQQHLICLVQALIEMTTRFCWNLQQAILMARWLWPLENVQAASMNYLYKSWMGPQANKEN